MSSVQTFYCPWILVYMQLIQLVLFVIRFSSVLKYLNSLWFIHLYLCPIWNLPSCYGANFISENIFFCKAHPCTMLGNWKSYCFVEFHAYMLPLIKKDAINYSGCRSKRGNYFTDVFNLADAVVYEKLHLIIIVMLLLRRSLYF